MKKDALVVTVAGRRGCGKSTFVKDEIKKSRFGVVFDPMGEYGALPGFTATDTIDGVKALMKKHWLKGFKIAYQPPFGKEVEALHQLSNLLMEVQKKSGYGSTHGRELLLVVEEANVACPINNVPADQSGFMLLCSRGRHQGINVVAVTQRMAEVHNRMRGNTQVFVFFAQKNPADIRTIAEYLGKERAEELKTIPNHEFYLVGASGDVTKGKNNTRHFR